MKTIRIECVRPIPHEDALYGTGTWQPGEEKDVPEDKAPFLLWHADVWADARPAATRKKQPIKPQPYRPAPRADRVDRELPAANLAYMTKAQMADYAARNFGDRLDPSQMTRQQLNAHVLDRMRERA